MARDDLSDLLVFLEVARERSFTKAARKLGLSQSEMAALAESSDKPAGTIRITTTDHAAKTILLPKLAPLLRAYRDIKARAF